MHDPGPERLNPCQGAWFPSSMAAHGWPIGVGSLTVPVRPPNPGMPGPWRSRFADDILAWAYTTAKLRSNRDRIQFLRASRFSRSRRETLRVREVMPGPAKRDDRRLEVSRLYEDVVGVEGRDGDQADAGLREWGGDRGEDPDHREGKGAHDPEGTEISLGGDAVGDECLDGGDR